MVAGRVGTDHQRQLGILNISDLITDGATAQAFEQGGHAGGMAQAGAVVHVVAAKAGAHQLLEQIGFFVAAFCRAKTGQGFGAMGVAQLDQTACRDVQRLVPRSGAKHAGPVCRRT